MKIPFRKKGRWLAQVARFLGMKGDAVGFIQQTTLGSTRLFFLGDGAFTLDGGGFFRVVPQRLWSILMPPDAEGRVPAALGAVAWQRKDGSIYLFETGLGRAMKDPRFYTTFGVSGQEGLPALLAKAGLRREAVRAIFLTHLHFDHAGGLVGANDEWLFPEAEIFVSRTEWQSALHPNELNASSYRKEILEPLGRSPKLRLIDLLPNQQDCHPAEGVTARLVPGHTPGHLVYELEQDGALAAIYGDIIPTRFHVRLPYITAYDLEPLRTLESKRFEIQRALERGTLGVFLHDTSEPFGFFRQGPRYAFAENPLSQPNTGEK